MSRRPAKSTKRKGQGRSRSRTRRTPAKETVASLESLPATGHVPPGPGEVVVRHYCQGIGDCHLLAFPKADGSTFFLLIDCGVHTSVKGGYDTVDRIAEDVKAVTGGRIDLLVITHEHWDHVSGFRTAAEVFEGIEVAAVWAPWTENPDDAAARALDRFRQDAIRALAGVEARLDGADRIGGHLAGVRQGLRNLAGFSFGAKGERVRDARDRAIGLAGDPQKVTYQEPGAGPLTLPDVPGVGIFVLGPPRDPALIGLEERASEMYGDHHGFGPGGASLAALSGALAVSSDDPAGAEVCAPFDRERGVSIASLAERCQLEDDHRALQTLYESRYVGSRTLPGVDADPSWRRIDHDWTALSSELAIRLDNGINNTSLVLAFELAETGHVLLFPADAQVGSWLSWGALTFGDSARPVTGNDLLARTAYLKVGHHGSHNATLKEKGLELMVDPDLAAFVPTNARDARKVRWNEMPFDPILEELGRRARGRVMRADDPWLSDPDGTPPFTVPSGAVRSVRHAPRPDAPGRPFWVEVTLC